MNAEPGSRAYDRFTDAMVTAIGAVFCIGVVFGPLLLLVLR